MGEDEDPSDLARQVIGLAMKVHRYFGPGFAEVVYQNALILELRKSGHVVECQHALKVKYEDTVVGEFVADVLVDATLLIELKSIRTLEPAHDAQLVNYLHAISLDHGLLLNFGSPSLQFRTKSRIYRKSPGTNPPSFS